MIIKKYFSFYIIISLLISVACNRDRIVSYYPNDNHKAIGHLKKGKKHGKSKLFYENGMIQEKGNWDNDQQVGKWEYYDSLGSILGVAYFKDDLQHGKTKLYYSNGILKEESYWENGLLNGLSKTYYETGKLNEETEWKKGKKNGETVIYYESGNIQQKGNWIEGKQDGLFVTFFENGDTLQRGTFIQGKKEGFFHTYYKNNKIYSIIHYEKDLQNGKTVYYHRTGAIEQEGLFKDNKPIGSWNFFNVNGELIKVKEF